MSCLQLVKNDLLIKMIILMGIVVFYHLTEPQYVLIKVTNRSISKVFLRGPA